MGSRADSFGTLGILGGGQLGRLSALAARSLGFRVHALDPSRTPAVSGVVDRLWTAPLDDIDAAVELARSSDVVTIDIEHVPADVLRAVARYARVAPSADALHVIQDRGRQKRWLSEHGFPVGGYRVAEGAEQLGGALRELGPGCFVKAASSGFDGRGQARGNPGDDVVAILRDVGTERVTVEAPLSFELELSVLVARRASGELTVYPPALNHHVRGVLATSLLPGPLPPHVSARAAELSSDVVRELGLTGLCVVEMFVMPTGDLLINELAPRPHNSYHGSERAFETSQFEQHVRAVFDLPLGPVGLVRPTAMANLLGDLWLAGPVDLTRAFAVPSVRVQLYGKEGARPGRKLGHLTATGATVDEALERASEARRAIAGDAASASASEKNHLKG